MSELMSVYETQVEGEVHASVGRAGLQAGLLGAVAMTLLGLLGIFGPQFFRIVTCGLLFVFLVVVGLFAGHLLGPTRTGRSGAGAGAIAGIIAGAGGAFGLAALPLDPLFSQNMEVLCASSGCGGLWTSGFGIAMAFIIFFLLLLVPAVGLSTITGAIYGSRRGNQSKRYNTDQTSQPDKLTEEDNKEPIGAPVQKASPIKMNWPILNLGVAILLLVVMGLLGAVQIVFIFQHGSVPGGGLFLVSIVASLLWIVVMVSVVLWYRKHPFRLWIGIMVWPLLLFLMLVGVCPSCKWAEQRFVRGETAIVYSFVQFPGYAQIVATGFDAIWATDVYYDTVKVINPQNEQVVGTVPVGANPIGVAVDDDAIWVVSQGDNTVYRIDPQLLVVLATIPVSSSPLLATTGAGSVWVTLPEKDQVVRIDAKQNKILTSISVGDNPRGLAADESYVWVANSDENTVSCIDANTNLVVDTIDAGLLPSFVYVSESAVWVSVQGDDSVLRIDPFKREVVAKIPVGSEPMALAENGDSIWVTLINENAVVRIDAKSNQVVGDPIPVGEQPMGIASDDSGVWVANFGEGSLGRIEIAMEAPVDQASAGNIVSAYLFSLFSFLGGVAIIAILGFLVWLIFIVIGSLLGRLTSRSYWVVDGIVLAAGLIFTWVAFRLTSAEIAVGVLAGTVGAIIVLRKMRQSVIESSATVPMSS